MLNLTIFYYVLLYFTMFAIFYYVSVSFNTLYEQERPKIIKFSLKTSIIYKYFFQSVREKIKIETVVQEKFKLNIVNQKKIFSWDIV